jgi:hypothetical protein
MNMILGQSRLQPGFGGGHEASADALPLPAGRDAQIIDPAPVPVEPDHDRAGGVSPPSSATSTVDAGFSSASR